VASHFYPLLKSLFITQQTQSGLRTLIGLSNTVILAVEFLPSGPTLRFNGKSCIPYAASCAEDVFLKYYFRFRNGRLKAVFVQQAQIKPF